jgi:DNA invertase Pin-like site-specific DNA recombinase
VKVAAYIRVSTDAQVDGLGPECQEQAITTWAKSHRHKITTIIRDNGISGTKELDNRPGLAEALALIHDGVVAGVVVYRLDRLARDLVLQEQLLAEIRRLGGELFTTSAAEAEYLRDDPDDPSRKLIRQILGAVSEYERAMISLRLRSGRRRKAEKGGFAYGSPAYGFRAERGELVEDADEQATVARIVALREEGASLRTIAATLNAEGHKPKRGNRWHPQTVASVLGRAPDDGEMMATVS